LLERLVEILRRANLDKAKAQKYLADRANEQFRDTVSDYDAFVAHMLNVKEPSVAIGTATDAIGNEIPARLELRDSACHWLIQGSTQSGKTSFATLVVAGILSHVHPVGVVDCKSGFFEAAIRWTGALAYRMEHWQRTKFIQSLAVINPFSNSLIPLNVCRTPRDCSPEVHAYEVSLALSRLFDSGMSFQMENILRHLLVLLIEADLSLVEAPAILRDELFRGILAHRSQNRSIKEFFLRTYPDIPSISKEALLVRLESLLLPENLRLMLGADELFDLKGALDAGHPLFIFLGKGPGVPEEQVEIIGSLILQLLFQAAFANGPGRRPYQIILDEFFHLLKAPALSRRFETALTSLSSYRVMLSLVMHNFSQVPVALRETILGNVDIMAIFRTSSSNAQSFGDFLPELDPKLIAQKLKRSGEAPTRQETRSYLMEQLQRLPARNCYWYDRRKPYRAVQIRVPDLPEPHEALGISASTLDEFIQTSGIAQGGFAFSKDVLRRQIETREKRLDAIVRPPIHVTVATESNIQTEKDNESNSKKKRKPRLG
jgi:hypothetical protein